MSSSSVGSAALSSNGLPNGHAAPTTSVYDQAGGREFFAKLVAGFYDAVAGDPALRALYPEEDLGPAADRLRMFLEQYFGGPTAYQEQRGHPRLRIRHAPYAITPALRDRWVRHMIASLDRHGKQLDPSVDATIREYVKRAADFLVNTDD